MKSIFNQSSKKNLLITDSGVGGLTVLKPIVEQVNFDTAYYFADNENLPYGTKTQRELKNIAFNNFLFFSTLGVSCVIVACNTLSTVLDTDLTGLFNFKCFGVYPPVYIEKALGNNPLLIATPKTCHDYEKVVRICPMESLASDIERHCLDLSKLDLEKHFAYGLEGDRWILGCTHYLFIEKQIQRYFNVTTTSGNPYTVKKLKNYLAQPLFPKKNTIFDHRFNNFNHFNHENIKSSVFYIKNAFNSTKKVVFLGKQADKYVEIFSKIY